MMMTLRFAALCLVGPLWAAEVPPSPSSVSGERIWPAPRFTHWPAVIYGDEARNASFELPVKKAGVAGTVGWKGGPAIPFVLPEDTERSSGLIDLPQGINALIAEIAIGEERTDLPLRLVDVREAWPLARLAGDFPVDAEGVPVVLVDRRRDPAIERQWNLLTTGLPRGTGAPLVVGDPLADLGSDAWQGLEASLLPALDDRRPEHAALVALAKALATEVPRTLVWSPGNAALFTATWSPEEERVLGAIRSRCAALGSLPRCVLLLPPIPVDPELAAKAVERRDLLGRSAAFQGWTVIDLESVAGPATTANRVSEGLYTRHPIGEARARITAAISKELGR